MAKHKEELINEDQDSQVDGNGHNPKAMELLLPWE